MAAETARSPVTTDAPVVGARLEVVARDGAGAVETTVLAAVLGGAEVGKTAAPAAVVGGREETGAWAVVEGELVGGRERTGAWAIVEGCELVEGGRGRSGGCELVGRRDTAGVWTGCELV